MATSLRNNRALNRVLRESLRARPPSEAAPKEPDAPAYSICADIPERYNDAYVRAIPKDPQNTFVYWELPKEHADVSLFADKGTAHVGNDEAVRIGEQLSGISASLNDRPVAERSRSPASLNDRPVAELNRSPASLNDRPVAELSRISATLNDRPTVSPASLNDRISTMLNDHWDNGSNQYGVDNYHHVDWDNPNQYSFDGGNHRRGADDCRQNDTGYYQISWDNGNQYRFDGASRQHHHCIDSCHHINWDDGAQYRADGGHQQHHHGIDSHHQINWGDGGRYRRDDAYQHLQSAVYQLVRNGGDGAAFSEMLSDLIALCNQHIADRRLSGDGPLDRAMSSGLLCGAGGEPRT